MDININLNVTIQGDRSQSALDRIESMLRGIITQEQQMAIDVTKLKAAVAKLTTVEESVLALITKIADNQKALAQQLADAIAANDPAAIQAAQTAIDEADALAAAVQANTPTV